MATNDLVGELEDAWKDFLQAVTDFTVAAKQCKDMGMTPAEIQARILNGLNDHEKQAFMSFQPMFMLLIGSL